MDFLCFNFISKGREMSLLSVDHAASSISAFRICVQTLSISPLVPLATLFPPRKRVSFPSFSEARASRKEGRGEERVLGEIVPTQILKLVPGTFIGIGYKGRDEPERIAATARRRGACRLHQHGRSRAAGRVRLWREPLRHRLAASTTEARSFRR